MCYVKKELEGRCDHHANYWELGCRTERASAQRPRRDDSSFVQRRYPAELSQLALWPAAPALVPAAALQVPDPWLSWGCVIWHSYSAALLTFWPLLSSTMLPLGAQMEQRASSNFLSTNSHLILAGFNLGKSCQRPGSPKSGLIMIWGIILATDWSCKLWK